jgi:hypothetical protein
VAGTIIANPGADTLTLCLVKNGTATAMCATVAVLTLNTTVSATTTSNQFSVLAGDTAAYQITQTNGAPTVHLSVSSACK